MKHTATSGSAQNIACMHDHKANTRAVTLKHQEILPMPYSCKCLWQVFVWDALFHVSVRAPPALYPFLASLLARMRPWDCHRLLRSPACEPGLQLALPFHPALPRQHLAKLRFAACDMLSIPAMPFAGQHSSKVKRDSSSQVFHQRVLHSSATRRCSKVYVYDSERQTLSDTI